MDVVEAARRRSTTWQRAWADGDIPAIVALYAPRAVYRWHPHRDPEVGGAQGYVTRVFGEESNVQCWFGELQSVDRLAPFQQWGGR